MKVDQIRRGRAVRKILNMDSLPKNYVKTSECIDRLLIKATKWEQNCDRMKDVVDGQNEYIDRLLKSNRDLNNRHSEALVCLGIERNKGVLGKLRSFFKGEG